jgi:hypothetical protein
MHNQRITETHQRHVWFVFGIIALCMAAMWVMPELQSADARAVSYRPGSPDHGLLPPPDLVRHPVFVPFLPPPGFFPENRPGFPPPQPRFVDYQSVRHLSEAARVTISSENVIGFSDSSEFSEQNTHPWWGHAQTSFSLNISQFSVTPPHGMLVRFHRPPGPPPGGFRLRPTMVFYVSIETQAHDTRFLPDDVGPVRITPVAHQQFTVHQTSLTQQYHTDRDRLHHLQILQI